MNQESLRKFLVSVRHWTAFIGIRRLIASIGGVVVAVGIGWFVFRPTDTPVDFVIPTVVSNETSYSSMPANGEVHVHVVGAVKKPGVYVLPASARVIDAVAAAGGSLSTADLEGINLAQTVMDAEQVLIPQRRSPRSPQTIAPRLRPRPRTTTTIAGSESTSPRLVNINTATATQLESLTGVGPATARAIIAYRTSKGLFTKVEDLLNVPGIGPSKLAAMRSEISVS